MNIKPIYKWIYDWKPWVSPHSVWAPCTYFVYLNDFRTRRWLRFDLEKGDSIRDNPQSLWLVSQGKFPGKRVCVLLTRPNSKWQCACVLCNGIDELWQGTCVRLELWKMWGLESVRSKSLVWQWYPLKFILFLNSSKFTLLPSYLNVFI